MHMASKDSLKFKDEKACQEVLNHYGALKLSLSSLGKSLKEAVLNEKIEKDELNAAEEDVRRQR